MRYAATRSSRYSMSVRLYARCLDDARPVGKLALHAIAEPLRRAARRIQALLRKHLAHVPLFEQLVYVAVHPRDDRLGGARRREHRIPGLHLQVRRARLLER